MPTMRTLNAQGNLYAGTPAPPVRCSRSMDSPAMKPAVRMPGWTSSRTVGIVGPTSRHQNATRPAAMKTAPARFTESNAAPKGSAIAHHAFPESNSGVDPLYAGTE